MSNPLTPAEVTAWLRRLSDGQARAESMTAEKGFHGLASAHSDHKVVLATAADLIESLTAEADTYLAWANAAKEQIESLTAERDGLAGLVLAKDESLKDVHERAEEWHYSVESECREYTGDVLELCNKGLALELPAAVAQVAEWREDSERFKWAYRSDVDGMRAYIDQQITLEATQAIKELSK